MLSLNDELLDQCSARGMLRTGHAAMLTASAVAGLAAAAASLPFDMIKTR